MAGHALTPEQTVEALAVGVLESIDTIVQHHDLHPQQHADLLERLADLIDAHRDRIVARYDLAPGDGDVG